MTNISIAYFLPNDEVSCTFRGISSMQETNVAIRPRWKDLVRLELVSYNMIVLKLSKISNINW